MWRLWVYLRVAGCWGCCETSKIIGRKRRRQEEGVLKGKEPQFHSIQHKLAPNRLLLGAGDLDLIVSEIIHTLLLHHYAA
jgi:hypothetical protein